MTGNRLSDYLDHIQQAASDARSFIEGLSKDEFLADNWTQQAVVMRLIIIGEAATAATMDRYPDFAAHHPEVPWRSMRGVRIRIAHGYFDINLEVVWDTRHTALPELLKCFPNPVKAQTMKTTRALG